MENYVAHRTFTNMGSLWNENITLKAALRTLETDYTSISKELEDVQLKSKEIGKSMKSIDDEKYLCKVPGCFRHHPSDAKATATTGITELENQISDIRARVRRKISEIKLTSDSAPLVPFYHPAHCNRHLWADLAEIHCDLAIVQHKIVHDIDEMKSRLNVIDNAFESMDELSSANSVTLKKIEGEQKHININVESINKSLEQMKKKMKLCWYDFHV